jgi:hypothetical protein
MAPHPIIMDVLWDDRNREVQAAAAQQRPARDLDEAPPASVRRHNLHSDILAILSALLGRNRRPLRGARS